mmetsp:Transcript_80803/g.142511  ORF Transcript_80803/g.142511 Transcript_80803/m.142511 type:complete len:213 (-) Transcript_80803:30-668(-)
MNSLQSQAANSCRFTSWRKASSAELLVVLAMRLSDATAVRRLSIVHDMKVMKQTKNTRHPGLRKMIGMAIFDQSSAVVSRKRVNSDVGIFAHWLVTASTKSASSCLTTRPWPTSRVKTMARVKHIMMIMSRIQVKVGIMPRSILTNELSGSCIGKMRGTRSNLDSMKKRGPRATTESWRAATTPGTATEVSGCTASDDARKSMMPTITTTKS